MCHLDSLFISRGNHKVKCVLSNIDDFHSADGRSDLVLHVKRVLAAVDIAGRDKFEPVFELERQVWYIGVISCSLKG